MKNRLLPGDAILVVDAQIDFFPGGQLPVPHGDEIIPIVNEWLKAAAALKIPVFASRDWHPRNHCSFKEQGGPWPMHCVKHSHGAKIHHDLKLPSDAIVIDTADDPNHEAYSCFQGKSMIKKRPLDDLLKERDIKRLWVSGLALDYCVCESALEAVKLGYEVHLLLEGTRAITEETGKDALERMKEAGVILETSSKP